MASVKSGWQVSTSDEEKAVDRFMPYITALMWTTWPTNAHRTKRGRSARRGQVYAIRLLKMTIRSASPSAGSTRKRRNMNAPTPR